MTNFRLNRILIFFIPFLFFVTGCQTNREARVDRLFSAYSGEVPGAVVMVIKNGQPIFEKAYGLANLEKNVPMQIRSNLRLASMTKQFTAMCILMLAQDGKLRLDQTLRDIFPEFPEYGNAITIREILQHTSGLIAYESLIPDTATVQVLDRDVLQMMMDQDSTYFTPGTAFRYSNSGYAVLAMIVEKVSGQSFAIFLRERIFAPLGMNGSVAYENGISSVQNRAMGYAATDSGFVFKDQSITSAVLGDGGIYTSVEDLYKWDQALYTGKLVKSPTLEQAFTPGVLANGDSLDYGFGWRIDAYKGYRRVHHTGSTCGFRNVIQRYPDARFTVIILTNRDQPDVFELADAITDLFLIQE